MVTYRANYRAIQVKVGMSLASHTKQVRIPGNKDNLIHPRIAGLHGQYIPKLHQITNNLKDRLG